MADANQPLGGTAIKPVRYHMAYMKEYILGKVTDYQLCHGYQVGWDRTGWEAFKYMLFDPDNGTILTRCRRRKYKKNANVAEPPYLG